jgi:hypothetical protein
LGLFVELLRCFVYMRETVWCVLCWHGTYWFVVIVCG